MAENDLTCRIVYQLNFIQIDPRIYLLETADNMSVVIETTIGDFTVDLYLKERPKTCLNFLKLCKNKAYNCR